MDKQVSYFEKEILRDLEEKGFKGQELLLEFKNLNAQVKSAVQTMLEDADKIAEKSKGSGEDQMEAIFGD